MNSSHRTVLSRVYNHVELNFNVFGSHLLCVLSVKVIRNHFQICVVTRSHQPINSWTETGWLSRARVPSRFLCVCLFVKIFSLSQAFTRQPSIGYFGEACEELAFVRESLYPQRYFECTNLAEATPSNVHHKTSYHRGDDCSGRGVSGTSLCR